MVILRVRLYTEIRSSSSLNISDRNITLLILVTEIQEIIVDSFRNNYIEMITNDIFS